MRQISGDDHFRASGALRRRTKLAVSAALAACTALTGVARAQTFTQYPARTSAVSSADGSHPFNSAGFARVPQNLAAANYVEKEYFLSGLASTYQYRNPSSTTDDSIALEQTAPVPYTNRILVRAPSTPAAFSGNVIVEIANDALISDNETAWAFANSRFIADGDVFILLTSTPGGLAALKSYAPTRYRALTWPTTAATKSCNGGASGENGIVYDQITALGTLLKSNSASGPLAGYNVKHLFLTGYSGAAQELLTYNRVFGLNSSLYDAYFEVAGGFRAALNACEASATTTGRAQPIASTVSAVFQAQTESELYLASEQGATIPSGTDSNTVTDRYRYYEIAGTGHVNGDLLSHSPERSDFPANGVNYLTNVTQAQLNAECSGEPATSVITAFPNRYVYDALWANLEQWVAGGTADAPPSEASRITNTSIYTYLGLQPATGGLRSPAVDNQIDNYAAGSVPPSGASSSLSTFCLLTGTQVSTGASVNAAATIADATTLNTKQFLTNADLAAIVANPSIAYTYPNGTIKIPDNPPAAQ